MADELRVEKFDTSGSSGAGEETASTASMSAAVLPAPPAEESSSTHTPRRGLILGVSASALVMLGVVGFVVYSMTGPESAAVPERSVPSPIPSPEATSEEPSILGPSDFDVVALGNGWTRYESQEVGFSIDLPPGWSAVAGPKNLARGVEFSAVDGPATQQPGNSPLVIVSKYGVQGTRTARQYFEKVRLRYSTESSGLIRQSGLTETQLPHGKAYVFTSLVTSEVGRLSSTLYGRVHGTSAYTLLIIVPMDLLDEYEEVLEDIANSFDVTL